MDVRQGCAATSGLPVRLGGKKGPETKLYQGGKKNLRPQKRAAVKDVQTKIGRGTSNSYVKLEQTTRISPAFEHWGTVFQGGGTSTPKEIVQYWGGEKGNSHSGTEAIIR